MKFLSLFAAGAAASAVIDKPLISRDATNLFEDTKSHFKRSEEEGSAHAHHFPHRIPTSYESAVMARRILALTPIGTVSTVFPNSDGSFLGPHDAHPNGIAGVPIGMPEYIAACEEDSAEQAGNPTFLALTIGTTFKNAKANTNVSLSLQWEPPVDTSMRQSWTGGVQKVFGKESGNEAKTAVIPNSPASLPRFSVFGYFETVEGQDLPTSEFARCFVRAHHDAKYWLPGNPIHQAYWARLVVTQVYWVGGFGDRAYIGWIPIDEWKKVTREEWEKVRLPGESKGWQNGEL